MLMNPMTALWLKQYDQWLKLVNQQRQIVQLDPLLMPPYFEVLTRPELYWAAYMEELQKQIAVLWRDPTVNIRAFQHFINDVKALQRSRAP